MLEWIQQLVGHVEPAAAYGLLFLSAFVENVFPPVPGDTVTIIGAYLITTGKLSFYGVWVSTTLGSVLGFFVMYLIGARMGDAFLKKEKVARFFHPDQIIKTEIWFDRYGYWIIAANRFLSGTRSVISLFAGIFRLKWLPVLLLATVSAFIWNGLLMLAGYWLGANWPVILDYIADYNQVVIALTVLVIAIILIRRQINKKKRSGEND
ncbi:MAG: DedA family protein [Calditrichaeota bacterium]|nr:MAG: DedA family protein [Calditrichota bacterium]